MRITVLMIAAALLVLPQPVAAEVHAVEITLFTPCNQEVVDAAIAALRAVPGVEQVQAAAGDLQVRVLVSADFTADPMSLVQVLWDMKVFPNRIYVEATVEPMDSRAGEAVRVVGTGQRFVIEPGTDIDRQPGPVLLRGEVLDWIEDQSPPASSPYTLRVVEMKPCASARDCR